MPYTGGRIGSDRHVERGGAIESVQTAQPDHRLWIVEKTGQKLPKNRSDSLGYPKTVGSFDANEV